MKCFKSIYYSNRLPKKSVITLAILCLRHWFKNALHLLSICLVSVGFHYVWKNTNETTKKPSQSPKTSDTLDFVVVWVTLNICSGIWEEIISLGWVSHTICKKFRLMQQLCWQGRAVLHKSTKMLIRNVKCLHTPAFLSKDHWSWIVAKNRSNFCVCFLVHLGGFNTVKIQQSAYKSSNILMNVQWRRKKFSLLLSLFIKSLKVACHHPDAPQSDASKKSSHGELLKHFCSWDLTYELEGVLLQSCDVFQASALKSLSSPPCGNVASL